MQKKTIWITSGAIAAALVLGGVGVAVADPFDDDDTAIGSANTGIASGSFDDDGQRADDDRGVGNDDLIGTDFDRASAAALSGTGEGTVTDAESSGSSDHAYEVDVRLTDGDDVEVYLDQDFTVIKVESRDDDSGSDDDSRDDDSRSDDSNHDRSGHGDDD